MDRLEIVSEGAEYDSENVIEQRIRSRARRRNVRSANPSEYGTGRERIQLRDFN